MKVHNLIKKTGNLIGESSKALRAGHKILKDGYKEGLMNKCPVCKEAVDISDNNKLEFIRYNKMCNDCLIEKNGLFLENKNNQPN